MRRSSAADTGVSKLVGEAGYTTLERKSIRPTLDVNGIWGGFQGHGQKTIIPAEAHAKISMRLVADQEPADIFEKLKAFVEEIAPPGVEVTVRLLGTGRPSQTPLDHAACRRGIQSARARVRYGAAVHQLRRVDPCRRQLPVDPRVAGRPRSASPSPTTWHMRRTSGSTSTTTSGRSGRSPSRSTRSLHLDRGPTAVGRARDPAKRAGLAQYGWVIRPHPGATLQSPHERQERRPPGRIRPRDH